MSYYCEYKKILLEIRLYSLLFFQVHQLLILVLITVFTVLPQIFPYVHPRKDNSFRGRAWRNMANKQKNVLE